MLLSAHRRDETNLAEMPELAAKQVTRPTSQSFDREPELRVVSCAARLRAPHELDVAEPLVFAVPNLNGHMQGGLKRSSQRRVLLTGS